MEKFMNGTAGIGHNQPPDPLIVEAAERVDTANKYLIERGDPAKWTPEIADKANFFVGQIGGTFTALDERRKDENRAWLAKQDTIYKDPLALLTAAKTKLADLRRAYLKREEDRLAEEKQKADAAAAAAQKAAEEAERRAQEAATKKGGDPLRAELEAQRAKEAAEAAAQVAAAAPERAQITGQFSPRATGLKDSWRAEITDLSEAFKFYNKAKNIYKSALTAAITVAIQGFADRDARFLKDEAKAGPGVKFIRERR
jgi:hypothetical protein